MVEKKKMFDDKWILCFKPIQEKKKNKNEEE